MKGIFEILIVIIILLDMAILYYKGIVRKDWGIIGTLAPMVFLAGAILYDLTLGGVSSDYFHTGIVLVLFGNLVSNLFIVTSKRFRLEIYTNSLVEILRNLKEKYDFIVDHAPVGVYVINITGRFEFVNKALCDFSGYTKEELLDMYITNLVTNETNTEKVIRFAGMVSESQPLTNYNTYLITKSGERKNIRIDARHTTNGHTTITGSITSLED